MTTSKHSWLVDPGRRCRHAARGFSLVEVLVAMALMAVLMVGVLPLFTKSMTNNVEGSQITEVTNHARVQMEAMSIAPYNGESMTVPLIGAVNNALLVTELWSPVEERWILQADFPGGETPTYSRVTRVRQFNVSAISQGDPELEDNEALEPGTASVLVHFKEIEVRVNTGPPTTNNLMGRSKTVTLRLLRAY